jgi:hypothetical protein
VVGADGTTQVHARATDEAGTVSEVVTTELRLDRTAPTVGVSGIAEGQVLSVAALTSAKVATADATSGLASQRITLNGTVVGSPVTIDAVKLLTGTHRLVVSARDAAGHSTTRTITFTVKASYSGAKALVTRLEREGRVGPGLAMRLKSQLIVAERADRRGKEAEARKALNRFADLAGQVSAAGARAALVDVARQLKAQL